MGLIQVPTVRFEREFDTDNVYVVGIETADDRGQPFYTRLRITSDYLTKACENGPQAVWDLLAHELSGTFQALKSRAENRPYVSARVKCRGREGMVTMVDRSNPLGIVVEVTESSGWAVKVPWAECKWA